MNCLPVNDPLLHRKLWGGSITLEARDAYSALLVYPGSIKKIAGQHSLNYPPSFLFRYLEKTCKIEVLYIYPIVDLSITRRYNSFL